MATTTTGDTTVPTVKKRTLSKPNKQVAKGKPIRAKKGTGNNPRPKTPTKGPAGPFKGTQARARQQGPGAGPPATRAFQIPGGRTVNVGILARPNGQKLPTLSGGWRRARRSGRRHESFRGWRGRRRYGRRLWRGQGAAGFGVRAEDDAVHQGKVLR